MPVKKSVMIDTKVTIGTYYIIFTDECIFFFQKLQQTENNNTCGKKNLCNFTILNSFNFILYSQFLHHALFCFHQWMFDQDNQ